MLSNAVSEVLPRLAFGSLKLASANEVIEGHGRNLDDPCNGGFGDLFLQEQCDFRLLAIKLRFAQGPLGAPKSSALGLCRCQSFLRPFRNEVTLHLGKQSKERNHGLGLQVVFALETNGLLNSDEANFFVNEPIDDLQNLMQTPSKA